MSEEIEKLKALLSGDFDYCTKCDSSNCKVDHAKEEKRLQALAELQEDGERMEKSESKLPLRVQHVIQALEKAKLSTSFSARACALAGYDKGAELERERVLDLVMEESKDFSNTFIDGSKIYIDDLKAIISKLRGAS